MLRDSTSGCVQVRKGGGGGRIRQIISRDIDGLRSQININAICPLLQVSSIMWQT